MNMEKFFEKDMLIKAEEVIRETIANFQAVWCSDATRFLGMFATSYSIDLLRAKLAPSFELDGIMKPEFSITHFLGLTNRDAVDLLYKVMCDVIDSYKKREVYEVLNNAEIINVKIQDIIKGIYPDLDPIYFSSTDPEQMRKISEKRIQTYVKTWIPGIR